MKMVLSARLQTVADHVGFCRTVADIGTDHAFLPIYLVQNDRCQTVYAADIAVGPLQRAEGYITQYLGKTDRIQTVLSDGVKAVPEPCDVTVVAGMGGDSICQILSNVPDDCKGRFVLQPMTSPEDVRAWLCENGWHLTDESVVEDAGFLYSVMSVEKGRHTVKGFELYFSEPLAKKQDTLTEKYLKKQISRLEAVVEGRKRSDRGLDTVREECILKELRRVYDEQYGR